MVWTPAAKGREMSAGGGGMTLVDAMNELRRRGGIAERARIRKALRALAQVHIKARGFAVSVEGLGIVVSLDQALAACRAPRRGVRR